MAVKAEARAWVLKVLGVSLPEVADTGAAKAGAAKDTGTKDTSTKDTGTKGGGPAAWTAARAAAIGQLKALEGAIAKMKHPQGNAAIILVKAIQANLKAMPESRRDVGELRRYLESDDIIAEAEQPNGFGIKVELKRPLLGALAALEDELAG